MIDGVDIASMGLQDLRSRITILPQVCLFFWNLIYPLNFEIIHCLPLSSNFVVVSNVVLNYFVDILFFLPGACVVQWNATDEFGSL